MDVTGRFGPEFEAVLAEAGWARALALRLLRDASLADDVVQETLLAALRSPPRNVSSVREWVAEVVRNTVRQFHRKDSARERREELAAAAEATPSAAMTAARIEAQSLLLAAVKRLSEPYRAVIVLRYFDRRKPAAIAADLGVPVETVKTRLKRAREMLRADLTRGGDPDGSGLLAALAPIFWTNPIVPVAPDAAPHSGPGRGLRGSRPLRWAALAAGLVAAGIAAAVVTGGADPESGRTSEGARAPAPSAVGRGPERERAAAAPDADRAGGASDPERIARGAVDGAAGAPDADRALGAIELSAADAALGPRIVWRAVRAAPERGDVVWREARLGASGVAPFPAVADATANDGPPNPVVAFDVAADHPAFLRKPVRVPRRDDGEPVRVKLQRGVAVTGTVVGAPEGAPIRVAAFDRRGTLSPEPFEETTADADGRFELRLAARSSCTILALAPGRLPAARDVSVAEDPLDAGRFTLAEGLSIRGRAAVSGGAGSIVRVRRSGSVPDEFVRLRGDVYGLGGAVRAAVGVDRTVLPASVLATVSDDGRFEAAGLSDAVHSVEVHARTCAVPATSADRRPTRDGTEPDGTLPEIRVEPEWIDLVATGFEDGSMASVECEGSPVVVATALAGGRARIGVSHGAALTVSAATAAGVRATVRRERGSTDALLVLRAEDPRPRTAVTIRLAGTGQDGAAAIRGAEVEFRGSAGAPAVERAAFVSGSARLETPASGRCTITVRPHRTAPGERTFFVPITATRDLSGAPVEIEAPVEVGGRIVVVARTADGVALSGALRVTGPAGRVEVQAVRRAVGMPAGAGSSSLDASGVSDLRDALAPGEYDVEVRPFDGTPPRRALAKVEPGRTTIVELGGE